MPISLEIFCPRQQQSLEQVFSMLRNFMQLGMTQYSLTHSATDWNAVNTSGFAAFLTRKLPLGLTQHLSASALDPLIWDQHMRHLKQLGIKNILCLTGDQPDARTQNTSNLCSLDLISKAKAVDLQPWASGYPIAHVRSPSQQADLDWTYRKIDAGARRLVTQFCFDVEVMQAWAEKIHSHCPETEILWGMLPIRSQRQINKLHDLNGLKIPLSLQSFLKENLDDQGNLSLQRQVVTLENQCLELHALGHRNFHVYSFNRPEACLHLLQNPILNPAGRLVHGKTADPIAA